MNDLFIDNLTILSVYVIGFIALLGAADVIANMIYEWLESRLMYGNAKVGDALKPIEKKCKFSTAMRNILAKLGFN